MKFLLQAGLIALLAYLAEQFLPWWSVAICAAVVGLAFKLNKGTAFWVGFAAISPLWMLVATVIDVKTQAILSKKIAPLFGFQNSISLILLTGMLGGIVGGLGTLSGQQLRTLFRKEEGERGYRNH